VRHTFSFVMRPVSRDSALLADFFHLLPGALALGVDLGIAQENALALLVVLRYAPAL